MANNLSRRIPEIEDMQREHQYITPEPMVQSKGYNMNFYTNLKDVLGETLWATYQKTNDITGGELGRAMENAYYNIDIQKGDYGVSLEKNAYIDDLPQDYKLTLSKRF
jgi:hypothetical protein